MATRTALSLIRKKNQLGTCSTPFLYTSLPLLLHKYNVKLSSYAFYGGKSVSYVLTKNYVACVPVRFLFSFAFVLTLLTVSISHFLIPAIKFSCCSSNEICLLCFLFFFLNLFVRYKSSLFFLYELIYRLSQD